jgi:hypothetical protein
VERPMPLLPPVMTAILLTLFPLSSCFALLLFSPSNPRGDREGTVLVL